MAGRILLALLASSHGLEVLRAEGNPHEKSCYSPCAQVLDPDALLPDATSMLKQLDTFSHIELRNHLGRTVPVFHFRQPARLSKRELPFSLALLTHMSTVGSVVEVPVPDEEAAADSWWPDYSWSHWLVCTQGASEEGNAVQHLGWRYTRKPSASGETAPDTFVALIVRPDGEKEPEIPNMRSKTLTEELTIGLQAPGWMVAMAAAVTARTVSRSVN
mmetsp:Transcript_53900/g.89483  ORF Transcript_53900/g.89483 Transcript_53900/m.89483 type:complete len:217 (+) Transcript_53900:74-724(+)